MSMSKEAFTYAWHGSGRRWDAVSLQIFGCAVGGFLFYYWGLKVPQEILDNPAWGGVAAIAIGAVVGITIIFGLRFVWFLTRHWVLTTLNPYLAFATIGLVVAAISLILYFADRAKGPMVWEVDSINSPLSFSRSSGSPLVVWAFQILGTNRSDQLITPIRAFIRSNKTPQQLELKFGGSDPVNTGAIQGGAQFNLVAKIPPEEINWDGGQYVPKFRENFGDFTFVFEIPGKTYSIRFGETAVDRLIAAGEQATTGKQMPHVVITKP